MTADVPKAARRAMLELRSVTKTFDGSVVLDSVSLAIAGGRTTALIGPSGCGKSTLLRILIGLLWPDSGSVTVSGTAVAPANVLDIRRKTGYVIQDGGLFPHMTARENITLMARYLEWESERIAARTSELAELTHFPADGLERFPAQLSGGQKQRVALMRALFLDPELVLLDEPLAALDPMMRAELQNDLRRIFETLGKTVVLVTHDIWEAAYLGDSIVLLRQGRIVQQGKLEQFVRSPADPFVTQFVNAQRTALETIGGSGA